MPQDATAVPTLGFYYHFKHDPEGPINNHAYELIGVGIGQDSERVDAVYRKLYDDDTYERPDGFRFLCLRSLRSWMGEVAVGDTHVPRFQRITDPRWISALTRIRNEMYGRQNV